MTDDIGELYEDDGTIPSTQHGPVPKWLIWSYILLPIGGIIALIIFWNGSVGWLDRGYWHELQEAAGTTFETRTSR